MQITRRHFVDAAVGMAAAAVARSGAAAENAASVVPPRAVGPNEKIRVAVIGLLGRGKTHVTDWIANPDAELVAIADCDPAGPAKRRPELEKMPRQPRFEQDFRRLLDDKSIDVISIATPNHWHAVMAVWAMQAGKDVYVEKPCSHNVEEGRVITQWARKLGRICQMGAQSRSMTGMRQAIDFVHSGRIGDVKVEHRPRGHARAAADRDRLRPLGGAGAEGGADPQAVALRLALGSRHRQRRPGQPESPRDRQGAVGAG
jgi:predicted dehydrogenase